MKIIYNIRMRAAIILTVVARKLTKFASILRTRAEDNGKLVTCPRCGYMVKRASVWGKPMQATVYLPSAEELELIQEQENEKEDETGYFFKKIK